MSHCQIVLVHHNPHLVYSVLDQFEESIIDQQHKQYANKGYQILQSKRKLASLISQYSSVQLILSPYFNNIIFSANI